jgi:hypothetical protein
MDYCAGFDLNGCVTLPPNPTLKSPSLVLIRAQEAGGLARNGDDRTHMLDSLPMRRPHVFGDVLAMIDGWYRLSRELERFR